MSETIERSLKALMTWCEEEGYKGWDPYDGLNSRAFSHIPKLKDLAYARLAWIQLFKRSPVNLRRIAGVPKEFNPKGLGLFLNGYCNLWRMDNKQEYLDAIRFLTGKILELRSEGWSGSCWGYNFDWQAKAFFHPKGTPTIVASSFIAGSLLGAYDILNDAKLLDTALSVGDFIMNDLNKTFDEHGNFAFSYSPVDNTTVYNASLMGSQLLARLYSLSGDPRHFEAAKRSARFCTNRQNPDGSWYYSPLKHHQWIDSFHTGFILESIAQYMQYSGDNSLRQNLESGFTFYIDNFISPEGLPKYYHSNLYPIDLHSASQFVVTCSRAGKFEENRIMAERVLNWAIAHMQSAKGFFYYQETKYYKNKIPYMRWTQAWMFLALTEFLLKSKSG